MTETTFTNSIYKFFSKVKNFFKSIFESPAKAIAVITLFLLLVMVVILSSLAATGVFGGRASVVEQPAIETPVVVEAPVVAETPVVVETPVDETFVPSIENNFELEQEFQVARQEALEAGQEEPVVKAIPYLEINRAIDSEIEVESVQNVEIINRIEFIPVNTKN